MSIIYPNREMLPSELQLGDVIRTSQYLNCPWSTAIVKRVDKDYVTLFRPYGTCADFSYTGGVICYTGIEEFKIPTSRTVKLYVYERKELE